jgi:hypothetical protein
VTALTSNRHYADIQRVIPVLVIVIPTKHRIWNNYEAMRNKINIINQYNQNISSHMRSGLYHSYMVTAMFNMKTHQPDHIEGEILNGIKNLKSTNPSSQVLNVLYRDLMDYRFKINRSLNNRIYERDISYGRVSFVWQQYDLFYSHLVQTLVKNASRPNKIKFHPLTYDFMDVNGSKHQNHVWDDDGTLHIHSIYLVRSEIAGKFDGLMEQQFLPILYHPKLSGIRDVHAEPIGHGSNDLDNVIEYVGKTMFGINPLRQRDDLPLTNQYPITAEERRLKREHAQAMAAA